MTITIQPMSLPNSLSIPIPGVIVRNWKLILVSFMVGVAIMIVSHLSMSANASFDHCAYPVFVNYQKELAERCGKHGLGADCQLPYPENQQFNWDKNMANPTLQCK